MRGATGPGVAAVAVAALQLLMTPPAHAGRPCDVPAHDAAPAVTRRVSEPAPASVAWMAPCEAALAAAPRSQQRTEAFAAQRRAVAEFAKLVALLIREATELGKLAAALAEDTGRDAPRPQTRLLKLPPAVASAHRACAAYEAAPSTATLGEVTSRVETARGAVMAQLALAKALKKEWQICDGPGPRDDR